MLRSLDNCKVFNDVMPVLQQLKSKYVLSVGSISDSDPLFRNLRKNKIPIPEKNVFSSEMLKCYKPDPSFYTSIIRRMNFSPEETIFIGDSLYEDVIGPKKAGINAILLDRRNEYTSAMDLNKEIYVIHKMTSLLDIIDVI